MAPTPQISLKLLVNKKAHRVLFAEAGKDFVDFLFSLLALPVATVIRLLDNKNIEGGLSKLYQSVADLNKEYIQSNQKRDVLLKPKFSLPYNSPQLPLLPSEIVVSSSSSSSSSSVSDSSAVFYKCDRCNNSLLSTCNRSCPSCSRTMTIVDDRYVLKSEGGFVKGLTTYMVMDDLVVSPMSTISNIALLNKFNIKDLGDLEEKVVHIGVNEGLELLKHSLNSKTVLTDVFLGKVVDKDDDLENV